MGQLGRAGGSGSNTATPTAVTTSEGNWTMVSAGDYHSCGITNNGTGYCWGYGISPSRLGNGQSGFFNTPSAVTFPAGVTAWAEISAGYDYSCGRGTTGGLYCWGGSVGKAAALQATPAWP